MNSAERIRTASNKLRRDLVMHAQRQQSLRHIHALVNHAMRGHVYLLVGPAGTGVSALARALRTLEVDSSRPHNPFQAVELTALAPTEGRFRYKSFWQSGLEALNAPILGQHCRATESPNRLTQFTGLADFRAGERYRADFQNALAQRGSRLCIVTKGHNMLARLQEEDHSVPLAAFYDIADNALQLPQAIVLAGGPALLRMLHHDAELNLNTTVTYVMPLDGDVREFKGLLKSYEEMLDNLIEARVLVQHAEEIFRAVLGCDGWLRRALVRALALLRDGSTLTWEDVVRQLPTEAERTLLEKDIALIRHAASHGDRVAAPTSVSEAPRLKPSRPRRRRRVGERNPARDYVGCE